MTAHGWFHKIHRKRPMILATVQHSAVGYAHALPFIIDTGAERTVVVPEYEDLLQIQETSYEDCPFSMHSIGGPVHFRFLPKCTIVLTDCDHKPYPIRDISVHFFAQDKMKKVPLKGKPDYPNIIGRDVLEQVSLGYCQTSTCLFITKQTVIYGNTLNKLFPMPFNPNTDITWIE